MRWPFPTLEHPREVLSERWIQRSNPPGRAHTPRFKCKSALQSPDHDSAGGLEGPLAIGEGLELSAACSGGSFDSSNGPVKTSEWMHSGG